MAPATHSLFLAQRRACVVVMVVAVCGYVVVVCLTARAGRAAICVHAALYAGLASGILPHSRGMGLGARLWPFSTRRNGGPRGL